MRSLQTHRLQECQKQQPAGEVRREKKASAVIQALTGSDFSIMRPVKAWFAAAEERGAEAAEGLARAAAARNAAG